MGEYYASPRWSQEITDCSMPMTFDQYSKCSYRCIYCFSQYQKGVGLAKENYTHGRANPVNVKRIREMFTLQRETQFSPLIAEKKYMQWGGLADPFDENERKYGVGLELLKFFREIDYPICFSTKSTWWTKDDRYMDLFRGAANWNVKFSIITLDEDAARDVEGGVDTPMERVKAIERFMELGVPTATLRLRPYIIGISNGSAAELIRLCGEAGATALSTEFFCLEGRSTMLREKMPIFNRHCGFDVFAFYKKYSSGVGYYRLCRNVKRRFVDEMEEAARAAGMRFYVSDAHFKERCDNGSCCGLPAEANYCRGQFCEALNICKKKGAVRWSDFSGQLEYAKKFLWQRATGYNCTSTERRAQFQRYTMYDYLRYVWNTPTVGQSPFKMFGGIMLPAGRDEGGDLIYTYDESRA